MKRLPKDTWLVIGLLLLLLGMAAVAAFWQVQQDADLPPLATFSTRPDGAMALHDWFSELGYATGSQMPGLFQPPAGADLLFILEPTNLLTDEEWQQLDDWVSQGGNLVLVTSTLSALPNLAHYELELRFLTDEETVPVRADEQLASPPLDELIHTAAAQYLVWEREDVTPLLWAGEKPVMVTFPQGTGRVVVSLLTYPLTNQGLKEAGNPDLALNLASLAPAGGTIWFDEWHHGVREMAAVQGPGEWLRYTPAGQALLYAAAIIFLGLALRGRRFGRPVPLRRELLRRTPLEHITAIANLNRRAGHRQAVQTHYHQQLKRELGRRYRLDSGLPDEEFLQRLTAFNPQLDYETLAGLLARLHDPNLSENQLIQLAQAVHDQLHERQNGA